ncbi:MAG: flagellar biosynthetic protein FliO [Pirellulales bacterium]
MSRRKILIQLRALLGLSCVASGAIAADSPSALPAWPDQAASVYAKPIAGEVAPAEPPVRAEATPVVPASFTAPPAAEPAIESNVEPVVESVAKPVSTSPPNDHRRLAPRRHPAKQASTDLAVDALPSFGLNFDSVYTTGAALAVVLGVFFLCAALVRRGAKKTNLKLPEEVVSVLGRVPLAARQFAELVRVGNKLVLVSVTPHGAEPLTEITDPAEIDRLVGLCRQGKKGSSTEEFDQIFRRLADESAPTGFLGDETPRVDSRLAAPADVFSAYRGARSA